MITIKEERILIKPQDITPTSEKFKVLGTMNPGATRMPNGDIVLYVRIIEKLINTKDSESYYSPRCSGEKKCIIKIDRFPKNEVVDSSDIDFSFKDGTKRLTFISYLQRVVLDKTGFNVKSIKRENTFRGISEDGELGIEDPRITKIGKKYIMTYVGLSREGNISTSCAVSDDCLRWKRKGIIFREQNKDVVIFPEKIKGMYAAFNRPEGNFSFTPPHILISYSKDLEYWGKQKTLHLSQNKRSWDYSRVGAGPPPLKTKRGWLFIYHGVIEHRSHKKRKIAFMEKVQDIFGKNHPKKVGNISIYSAGAALLKLNDPSKVIARTSRPIIIPIKKHERGTFENKNVYFPTGIVEDINEEDLLIFAGAGDTYTTVKKVSLKDIFDELRPMK
ncbi:hypothetical protein HY450_03580 [Candidatus Pacearchaeota archaeon]|nr:hypothetical protein [Candidatus Pacearchaeota archaeon]